MSPISSSYRGHRRRQAPAQGDIIALTGIGLYTLQEVTALTGAVGRQANRWLFGYRHANRAGTPLWPTQLDDYRKTGKVIGFRDLLELRVVLALVAQKVPLRVIRAAIAIGRQRLGEYPLTSPRFLTDGRSIIPASLAPLIHPSLHAGIEFDCTGQAKRWFPLDSKMVVLDPGIAFGKPILTDYGVRTSVVAQTYAMENSKSAVATLLEIPAAAVDAALRFERMTA